MNITKKLVVLLTIAGVIFVVLVLEKIVSEIKIFSKQKPVYLTYSENIKKGDSLYQIFSSLNFSKQETVQVITEFEKVFDTKKVKVGDSYTITYSTDNKFKKFTYSPDIINTYIVEKIDETNYVSKHLQQQVDEKIVMITGRIEKTLWDSIISLGLSGEVVLNFADIFSWQIDFLTETRPNDQFKIILKQYFIKGKKYKDGEILAAYYNGNFTKEHFGILFVDNTGKKGYYDLNGNSLTKEFLKAPLNYRRISSFFTKKRFHPILRYFRPHLGIDYSAPAGTPVVTIGNGRVIFAGWKGGFGKTVIIKHNSIYTTTYGHLSRFQKGISVGKQVRQGEVIGYVGSTGLSTGPHLDFRIQQNGKYVNFLTLKFPPSKSLTREQMEDFNKQKNVLLNYLTNVKEESFEIKDFSKN
ncbi:MAG: peptidoglycan DD-metalloendopeptidase family protein [Endomicrobiia bacterium]